MLNKWIENRSRWFVERRIERENNDEICKIRIEISRRRRVGLKKNNKWIYMERYIWIYMDMRARDIHEDTTVRDTKRKKER